MLSSWVLSQRGPLARQLGFGSADKSYRLVLAHLMGPDFGPAAHIGSADKASKAQSYTQHGRLLAQAATLIIVSFF